MKLLKNMMYNATYQLLALLIPLVTTPYVSRVLQNQGIGIFEYTSSIVAYFSLIGALGINIYGNREIASVQRNKYKRSKVFWELLILRTVSISVVGLAYLAFVFLSDKWQVFYLLQGINLLAIAADISWYFTGIEDFRRIVIRNTIVKLTTMVLTFLLVRQASDLGMYIFLIAFAVFLGNLTVWPYLKTEIVKVPLKKLHIWRHLWPAVLLVLPQMTMQIYLSLNKTMLGQMVNVVSAGYFGQSDKIIRVLFTIVTAIGGVFLPRLSSLFSDGKKDEAKDLTLKLLDLSNAISLFLIGSIVGVSSTFATFFFGKGFEAVGPLMAVQSLMILLISYGNALGAQYILASKRTKDYTLSAVAGLVTNVIANFIFIPTMGAMGAVISTLFTEFAVSAYQAYSLRDIFTMRELFAGLYKYVLAGLATLVVVSFLDQHMPVSFLSYAVQGMTGLVVYAVVAVLLRASIVNMVQDIIKERRGKGTK